MTRCVVYQPGYFQPLHYFARMLSADVFVLLDAAQLNRKVGQTTAKIKGKGGVQTLNLPVKGGKRISLQTAYPDYEADWQDKHLKAIRHCYSKALNFDAWYRDIEFLFADAADQAQSLAELGEIVVKWVNAYTWHDCNIVHESTRPADVTGSEWMLDIAKRYNADTYICGKPAYDSYLDLGAFKSAGISVEVQDWECPKYKQVGTDFVPNLSIIDLLMNCTREQVVEILGGIKHERRKIYECI